MTGTAGGAARKYCPNCDCFKDLQGGSRDNPPLGALTPEMLEDSEGNAKYGCYNSQAWIDPMPMRVVDIQLLRAIECGSFILREHPGEEEGGGER